MFSEPAITISTKIDPCYQRHNVGLWFYVARN